MTVKEENEQFDILLDTLDYKAILMEHGLVALSEEIDVVKSALFRMLIEKESVIDDEVVALSQKLDNLINDYYHKFLG